MILLPNLLFSQPKQRLLLDKAYRHLLDQGFGVLELSVLDLNESGCR